MPPKGVSGATEYRKGQIAHCIAGAAPAVQMVGIGGHGRIRDGIPVQCAGPATCGFFEVDPATGRSFDIMSIDIVTVKDGVVSHVYHLGDWSSAVAQLTAEEAQGPNANGRRPPERGPLNAGR